VKHSLGNLSEEGGIAVFLVLVILLASFFFASGFLIGSPEQPQTTSAANSETPGRFVDVTQRLGVNFQHQASHTSKKYLPETMGSGVALFDYDNDGRLDIFLVNGALLSDPSPKGTIPQKTGPKYWNRLCHQKTDGTFEDVTEKAGLQGTGYGMGVAMGDYDNDGYEDLYVTAHGGNKLYHNNGDGTFSDVTAKAGVGGSGWSTSAAWVDLEEDGLLLQSCTCDDLLQGQADRRRSISRSWTR
jgi:enediyne biosynthesis protein E4